MEKERLVRLIRKMLDIIKPSGVKYVDFTLNDLKEHYSLNDSVYQLNITYVVPDDSVYRSDIGGNITRIKMEWNSQIVKTIRSYFGVPILLNDSKIKSESEHESWNKISKNNN